MISKMKKIIIESVEITPGIVSLANCNSQGDDISLIEREQWANHIILSSSSKGIDIKFSILIKDYLNIENIIKKLTTTIKYQAKTQELKIANISIFIKGVIYE